MPEAEGAIISYFEVISDRNHLDSSFKLYGGAADTMNKVHWLELRAWKRGETGGGYLPRAPVRADHNAIIARRLSAICTVSGDNRGRTEFTRPSVGLLVNTELYTE